MTSHLINTLHAASQRSAFSFSEHCVFCAIVCGEADAFKVWEDQHSVAFLDINPIRAYHTILIPKAHHERLHDLPPSLSAKVGGLMPLLSRAIARVTGNRDLNLVSNQGYGQSVPHIHWHFVPAPDLRNLSLEKDKKARERNLPVLGIPGLIERRGELEDEEGERQAKALREAVEEELKEERKEGTGVGGKL
ncbi:HIT-like protein [Atractiella rhizophila]|nr:HIT-like protein [Atractiella rhizophila]